ncbi:MAG: hypothetical protein MUF48_07575 [Pirellulaceae bacterium]|nr:hypothetical protein [Pirellulaceae bacterium]
MGTSASYNVGRTGYYQAALASADRLAAARAAVIARQQYLMREFLDGAARLEAAERAMANGDVQVASRIFMTVARARPVTAANQQARQRLDELADEGRRKLEQVGTRLTQAAQGLGTDQRLGINAPLPATWQQAVTAAFAEYEQVCEQYDGVPKLRGELRSHVAQQRQRPEFAAVLSEGQAAALMEVAQQHVRDDHACCAYWVYKEAAALVPAPSARQAALEVSRIEADPQLMAAARACRELQQCHQLYKRAESLAQAWPNRAVELLTEVLHRAPPESEVYRAADRRVREIAPAAADQESRRKHP